MFSLIFITINLLKLILKIEKYKEENDSKIKMFLNSSFVKFFSYESLGFSKRFNMFLDIFEFVMYFLILNDILGLTLIVRVLVILIYRLIMFLFFR